MGDSDKPNRDLSVLHKEAQHWLLCLTSGTATAHDARAFRLWCAQSDAHVQAFAETRHVWERLGPAATAYAAREQGSGAASARAVNDDSFPASRKGLTRRAFLGGAVAAAAWMVVRPPLNLWPSMSEMTADYRTATGEQRDVALATDLIVHMNTQTSLNIRHDAAGAIAVDLLDGEIQLRDTRAAHAALTVLARGGQVEIGAQARCNIRCFRADIQVTGIDGISTLLYGQQKASLHSGQRADYGEQGIGQIVAASIEDTLAWRRRELIFDGKTLAQVVDEINRYRPGELFITNRSLAGRKVQGRISLNQLDDVAGLIQDAYGAKVVRLPGGIVILS